MAFIEKEIKAPPYCMGCNYCEVEESGIIRCTLYNQKSHYGEITINEFADNRPIWCPLANGTIYELKEEL